MADLTAKVHLTTDDMRPILDEKIRMIMDAHSHEHDTARERLDHMQERLNQQAARIRHLEHQITALVALPGVAEALAAAEELPSVK